MTRMGGIYHRQGALDMAKAMQTPVTPSLDQIFSSCKVLTGLGLVKVRDVEAMPMQALMWQENPRGKNGRSALNTVHTKDRCCDRLRSCNLETDTMPNV